ncbi:MAG: hypothetical protein JWN82_641 [Candidatus Saccharibacteria bacterium]|nr:hypothetical protein [Candidatus Saccharibacteria bacterium]
MIQFNLLPDVKLQYMRAERTKRLVVSIASTVTVVSLIILVVLCLVVFVFQKKYMNDLSSDITTYSKDLQATPDLNKILTVQNQLNSLTDLHKQKPDPTRLFPYIKQITPADASIASLTIDFETQTMVITGAANSLSTVNKYVDTLKFTEYKKDDQTTKAFSEVVLATFGRADKGASFTINLKFDPVIFSNTEKVTLSVPDKITTRSETEKPGALFEALTGTTKE